MEKIREAVEYFKKDYRHFDSEECPEHTRVVLDLAEKVLAVGIGLSVEDIILIMSDHHSGNREEADKIATSIHKAQMEKLGGVK